MIDRDKTVPDDFRIFTRGGEVTGEKRERLYRVLNSTIDKVLEQLEGDDDDCGQDTPIVFMDAECPHCGETCGNGGYGDTFYCYHCGWTGKVAIHPDDIKALEGFMRRHQERNKEATQER